MINIENARNSRLRWAVLQNALLRLLGPEERRGRPLRRARGQLAAGRRHARLSVHLSLV